VLCGLKQDNLISWSSGLQVRCQRDNFVDEEIKIGFLDSRVRNDHSKEIWAALLRIRLVGDLKSHGNFISWKLNGHE